MNPKTNFFICSCVILAFAIVNLHIGPTVTIKIKNFSFQSCKRISDELDEMKNPTPEDIKIKEKEIRECLNRKAMSILEYSSFIINMGIGFICFILGLHSVQKETIPKTGLIGIILGVIGFILTFVYVILNGIVYTNYYDDVICKKYEDGAYAELIDSKYKCYYFTDVVNVDTLYAKFSDLIKSQYNYNKVLEEVFDDINTEQGGCSINFCYKCSSNNGYIDNGIRTYTDKNGEEKICQKLYYYNSNKENYEHYDISARFLACLILSLLTALCHCGLAFCGFMLFKEQ